MNASRDNLRAVVEEYIEAKAEFDSNASNSRALWRFGNALTALREIEKDAARVKQMKLELATQTNSALVIAEDRERYRARVAELEQLLLDANGMLRSCHEVAKRMATLFDTQAFGTGWGALQDRLHEMLVAQHDVLKPLHEALAALAAPAPGGQDAERAAEEDKDRMQRGELLPGGEL